MKITPLNRLLLTAGMSAALFISSAYAIDLGKTLEDVAKQQLEEISQDKNTNNTSEVSATAAATQAEPTLAETKPVEAKPAFNWKKPSREEEVALGRDIAGSILGAAPLVKDEALQKYVNQVGRWVANQSERANLPWKFGVIESADVNAFAAPGGYVLVTKGLYQKLQNEAQLAGVLGHEIAHVTQKHQLKVLQKQQLLGYGSSRLAMIFKKENKVANKIIANSAEISARALDKEAEFEADHMGMVLATRAGYEPYGLAEILQTIGQVNKNDNSVALLFKTHPHPDERLAKLGDTAGGKFDAIKNGKTLENRFYVLK